MSQERGEVVSVASLSWKSVRKRSREDHGGLPAVVNKDKDCCDGRAVQRAVALETSACGSPLLPGKATCFVCSLVGVRKSPQTTGSSSWFGWMFVFNLSQSLCGPGQESPWGYPECRGSKHRHLSSAPNMPPCPFHGQDWAKWEGKDSKGTARLCVCPVGNVLFYAMVPLPTFVDHFRATGGHEEDLQQCLCREWKVYMSLKFRCWDPKPAG